MKIDIMGVRFDNLTLPEALDEAERLLASGEKFYCVTPNSEIVYEAMHSEELTQLLNEAALVLPDGAGVVLASKILKTPLRSKVAGVDFADGLLGRMEKSGLRLFLLGSKPGVAELAAEKMLEKHPQLQIVGTADGYFKDDAEAVAKVNAAGADVLFVCLGAPKQERFIKAHLQETDVRMMIGLGGTLDSFAGTVKRAPKWMIKLNLEWFYRLLKEPKRLGRMMRLPKFLLAVLRKKRKG